MSENKIYTKNWSGYMRRYLIAGASVFVVIVALFFIVERDDGEIVDEKQMKQMIVNKDKQATIHMSNTQHKKDLQQFVHQLRTGKVDVLQNKLNNFTDLHPNIEKAILIPNHLTLDKGIYSSNFNKNIEQNLHNEIKKTHGYLKRGKAYTTTVKTSTNKKIYTIIGIPSNAFSIIGLVNQNMGKTIEKHQNKNLKLVTFPNDNRYSIQSSDGQTLQKKDADTPEQNEGLSHYHKHEIVVKFSSSITDNDLDQIKQDINAKQVRKIGYTYVFKSNTLKMDELNTYFTQNWDIEFTEPHFLYITNQVPNDVLFDNYQWNLPMINTIEGWNYSKGSEEIIVAVVDPRCVRLVA